MKTICITGAAGNLGQLTAQYLLDHTDCKLHLMVHRKSLPARISHHPRVTVFRCDIANPETIVPCLSGVDVLLHYASVLFQAHPERFMGTTNTKYFKNVVSVAKSVGIPRVILSSFPQVEGPTSPSNPSTDKQNSVPSSIHARTRLAEEAFLRSEYPDGGVVLRIGMVYGRGILMPDGARWFARHWLLGVWNEPTPIHLISAEDYLACVQAAALKDNISGTYNLWDDGQQTVQQYLTFACRQWNCRPPWRMPLWMIYGAARVFEAASAALGIPSPLTKDFLDIGRVPYWCDTSRMRSELRPILKYPTMVDGAQTF